MENISLPSPWKTNGRCSLSLRNEESKGLGVRLYFPYLCNAISITLPCKMPLVTLLLDADYTVI